MNWYVVYTRSRCEKAVAEKLKSLDLEVYCPLLRRKKLWSDRWKWVEEPLFRSYCFVRVAPSALEDVFKAPGVVKYVFHCGRPAIVREREIELLKSWLDEYDHEYIEADALNVSDTIKIRSGALIDKTGEVIENKGNYTILVLEKLGLRVKIDLRKTLFEKV